MQIESGTYRATTDVTLSVVYTADNHSVPYVVKPGELFTISASPNYTVQIVSGEFGRVA